MELLLHFTSDTHAYDKESYFKFINAVEQNKAPLSELIEQTQKFGFVLANKVQPHHDCATFLLLCHTSSPPPYADSIQLYSKSDDCLIGIALPNKPHKPVSELITSWLGSPGKPEVYRKGLQIYKVEWTKPQRGTQYKYHINMYVLKNDKKEICNEYTTEETSITCSFPSHDATYVCAVVAETEHGVSETSEEIKFQLQDLTELVIGK